jgi:hypothetical protein
MGYRYLSVYDPEGILDTVPLGWKLSFEKDMNDDRDVWGKMMMTVVRETNGKRNRKVMKKRKWTHIDQVNYSYYSSE